MWASPAGRGHNAGGALDGDTAPTDPFPFSQVIDSYDLCTGPA
jgi:hypothetical protein